MSNYPDDTDYIFDAEEYDWDEYPGDYGDEDPWYPIACDTPGCIALPVHFRSECHTARDMEMYYAHEEGIPLRWQMREPFCTVSLIWQALKHRDWDSRHALHFHWHVDLRMSWGHWLDRLTPRWWHRVFPARCADCGKRRGDHSSCLPF